MSDHALPADHGSWPSDPFRLLGVTPGVSARDLRKAYLALIRTYKPEHHPAEFQKIRQAYETALAISRRFGGLVERPEIDFEPLIDPEPIEPDRPPTAKRTQPLVDPWNLVCQGEPERGYRHLSEAQDRDGQSEEVFLQLYWLLTLIPPLDPSRVPIDWLIRGLERCGPKSGRLRELLRRELAAEPSEALRERVFAFLKRSSSPALILDVAVPRWKAARLAGRWSLIVTDINSLRGWLPGSDTDAWSRVLLAAAANLAWAERPDSDFAVGFCREVETLGHRQQDYAVELYQVEFAQILKAGLDRLHTKTGGAAGLYPLLSCSWDEPGPTFQAKLRSYVDQIAANPQLALEGMDQIQEIAPAVLGRLSSLLGELDLEDSRFHASRVHASLAPVIERFLAEHRWNDYQSLRLPLLQFCRREAISPGMVARTLAERPEFVLTGKSPLAQSITDDHSLRHVYRAVELSWEAPSGDRLGL